MRVGLAGADMRLRDPAAHHRPGPRLELLYTGRLMTADEGDRWGFFNRLVAPEQVLAEAQALAAEIADGPTFANGITKTCLHQEWAMDVDSAIEAEAQAQAICMQTKDYGRAYRAFVAKQKPVFEGIERAPAPKRKRPGASGQVGRRRYTLNSPEARARPSTPAIPSLLLVCKCEVPARASSWAAIVRTRQEPVLHRSWPAPVLRGLIDEAHGARAKRRKINMLSRTRFFAERTGAWAKDKKEKNAPRIAAPGRLGGWPLEKRYAGIAPPARRNREAAGMGATREEEGLIVFEGRDGAGQGRRDPRADGARQLAHLPRRRIAALTEREKSQMYVQRYLPHLPAASEVVIFDRSWYNRAGVERVMGFCTERQVEAFSQRRQASSAL